MDARYIDQDGQVRKGHLLIMQQVGEQADGKLHMVLGRDEHVFNLEDGDRLYTAVFAVDPFET